MERLGLLLAVAVVVTVLVVPAGAAAASASLSLDGSGALAVGLTGAVANGSALRYAMDGQFGPLITLAISNASQRATILAQINATLSNPLAGLLVGNRDGTVTGNEVTMFESLLAEESQFLPAGTLSGTAAFGLTLDGQGPTSEKLTAISFVGATGPDSSTAPIDVTTSLTYQFPYAGSSHTLTFAINLTSVSIPIGLSAGLVNVSVALASGLTVTSTSGFTSATTSNDPLGWGAPSVAGTFAPSTQSHLSVSFSPSFPTGDVLVLVVPLAVVGLVVLLLVRRRRRRRAAPP